MLKGFFCFLPAGLLVFTGCGYDPGLRNEGSEFKGKLTDAAGKPISGVSVVLQPTIPGALPSGGKVEKDGSFKGKAVPGDYIFSIAPVSENAKSMAFLKGINKKYLSPDAANKVTIAAGGTVEIKLSN
jgi:hypothetical protein